MITQRFNVRSDYCWGSQSLMHAINRTSTLHRPVVTVGILGQVQRCFAIHCQREAPRAAAALTQPDISILASFFFFLLI